MWGEETVQGGTLARVRLLVVAASVLVTALLLCATASAAPFSLGASTILVRPTVALDSSGNAYVAFATPAVTNAIDVCEIPAGMASCANLHSFTDPLSVSEEQTAFVFVDGGGVVHLLQPGGNGDTGAEDVYSSSNQGQTWTLQTNSMCPDAPSCTGSLTVNSAAFDPTSGNPTSGIFFGASDSVHASMTVASPAGGVAVNAAAASTRPTDANLVAPWTDDADGPTQTGTALSRTSAGLSLVNAWNSGTTSSSTGAQGVGYAYYSGPALSSASSAQAVVNDVGTTGNWTLGALGDGGNDISLAGGPSGTFLSELSGSPSDFKLRAFTGSGFGAAASADCGGAPNETGGPQGGALSEDPTTGALQFVFVDTTSIGTGLYYTEFAGGSQSPPDFSAPLALSQNPIDNVAVASDGSAHPGLVAYYDQGSGNLEAAWLPSVTTTGCAATAPPPVTTPTKQSTSTTIGGQLITLTTPSVTACTAASGKLSATLAAKTTSSSSLKFATAAFYLDKGIKHVTKHKRKTKHGHKTITITTYLPNATAKRLPVTESLSLAGLKSGKHTLTVKIAYKETKRVSVGHGKHKHKVKETVTVTHTLKASFTVC